MNLPSLSTLSLSLDQGIAEIRLNRPDKSNAMNDAMWQEIRQAADWVDATPEVRVAILSGEGRNFCAGIDLAMLGGIQQRIAHPDGARSREMLRRLILDLQDCLSSIERCRKPVLAAIQGACVGGALDLVTCCDMRYAASDAVFSVKEIDLAMVADVGTLQRLPRLIGEGMVLHGNVDFNEGLRIDGAARQHHVEGAALADQTRQAHRAAVRHRPTISAAEHAEDRRFVSDAQVAPDGQCEARGDCVSRHAGDDRLLQHALGDALVVARPAEAERGTACQFLEVGAGAEIVALACENGHLGVVVCLEGHEGVVQRLHRRDRAGIACLRPVDDHRRHRAVAFDQNVIACHAATPFTCDQLTSSFSPSLSITPFHCAIWAVTNWANCSGVP